MSAARRGRARDVVAATDRFVGRESEQDKISLLLLGPARLITLTGPGGIGKTRLAAETLRRFRKAGGTPVYWTRLARLPKGSDALAVEEEAARSVAEADFSGRSAWDSLVGTLTRTDAAERNLRTVLVMDNCEHVVAGAGRLIAELLDAVPTLTILATSRAAVGWADEHLVQVPPLTRPQAVLLFRQRAELTGHPVTGAEQEEIVGQICHHVHDNPLYVRLAAARLVRQPPAMILAELSGEPTDKRMRWSHGPRVGSEPRHRGVRDAIAWSYDLCRDTEKLLLDRMSVFAAGYDTNTEDDTASGLDVGADLDAIEMVCADDDPAPGRDEHRAAQGVPAVRLARGEIEGALGRLVDQSLVTVHITPTAVRYSLLESIRVFAHQRLCERSTDEVDESERFARRHRRYYRDEIVRAQREWFGPAERELIVWVRAAGDNIATAIESSLSSGEVELGLEIAMGIIGLQIFRRSLRDRSLREVCGWIENTLQATRLRSTRLTDLQIEAMASLGWLALLQGRTDDTERILEDCATSCLDDPETARNWRRTPDTDLGLPAPVEFLWGVELMMVHHDPRSVTVLGRGREKLGAVGNRGGEARIERFEAWAASLLAPRQQALEITRRHLDHTADARAGWAKAWAEMVRAIALTKHGEPTAALELGRTALAQLVAARDLWGAVAAVSVRTWTLAKLITDAQVAGHPDRARLRALATEIARLAGGSGRELTELGADTGGLGPVAEETNRAVEVARNVLGAGAYADAAQQGALLRPQLGEVHRLALGTLPADRLSADHTRARANATSLWDELSGAERQVALLAAAGWTNTAIAARRGSSAKTVDAQMAAILQKLMITSRMDIMDFVPADRIGEVRAEAAKRPRRNGGPRRKRP
ncbi:AAA family ATPase [Nocardia sp. BMG51109]|uniref:ATP-binding protein n=1 Tax=Nocardia sp. BMG51109 TaxID=1056816 RepID=UPI0004668B34|nr:AAA family ATPase [Nocardia sp. BMG51109]